MEIDVTGVPIEAVDADTFALAIPDPADPLPAEVEGLWTLVASGEAPTQRGSARLVHVDGRRVLGAGVGPRAEVDADAIRDAAAGAARELQASVGGSVAWILDPALLAPEEQARAVIEGAVLGGYDPGAWKTQNDRPLIERLTLVSEVDVGETARQAGVVAEWTNHARDLANRPANDLTPVELAEHAAGIAARFDTLTSSGLGPEEMLVRGMGAILAVGQGSQNEPRMILMRYEPTWPTQPDLVLGLVGKGMTFDTGGISLKKRDYMEDMKGDMAGGGAVIAAMGAIAELGLPVRVIAVVGAKIGRASCRERV